MKQSTWHFRVLPVIIAAALFLSGCGETGRHSSSGTEQADAESLGEADTSGNDSKTDSDDLKGNGDGAADTTETREGITEYLLPQEPGTIVYGNDDVSIDASNISEGYVCLNYTGDASKVKIQITVPDETVYTYLLPGGSWQVYPLTGGDGAYHIDVYTNVYDDMYALIFSQDMEVKLNDEFKPYLYPNQYVWYTQESEATTLALELSRQSADDLDFVGKIYDYVISNITYDEELAEDIPTDYIPDIDNTLSTGKGICFDYASLMSAMLRCQGVPTRLEVGYSGTAYHAWISVYLDEIGWVDDIIEFDGTSWTLMDPTLAASNSKKSVEKYIGDGSNYQVKYLY